MSNCIRKACGHSQDVHHYYNGVLESCSVLSCDCTDFLDALGEEKSEKMTISAKFKVQSIVREFLAYTDEDGKDVKGAEIQLVPDYADGKNKDWSKWTPAGVIRLTITNPVALEQLPVNKSVTILIQPED